MRIQDIHDLPPRTKDFLFCMLLLVVSACAFSMLLVHPVIHDFYNEFFPQRFFQINSIRHRILPLWNPYQSMGTPAHADPQTGTFYLPAYLFALFGEYTSLSCGVELILHIFLAACGFYFLTSHFVGSRLVSFIAAAVYSLSGFFVGNAQHLTWIIAGAWLPWVLHYFISFLQKPYIWNSVKLAVAASFLISGGYPGFSFGLIYLLIILFISEVLRIVKERNFSKLRQCAIFGVVALLVFLLLSTPTLLSFLETHKLATRGQNLDYSQISCEFPSLITLFIPFSVTNEPGLLPSDISMRSLYIGLIPIALAIVGVLKKREGNLWILFGFGIFSLLVAYGKFLPFHKLAFYCLPLFKVMRIPTLMRIFFIIPLVLFAAVGLEFLLNKAAGNNGRVAKICFFVILGTIAAMFFTRFYASTHIVNDVLQMSFYKKLMTDLIFILSVAIIILIASKINDKRLVFGIFSTVTLVDIALHVYLSGPYTIYNKMLIHSDLAEVAIDRGWPLPDRLTYSGEIAHDENMFLLWQNVGCFYKKPEWISYNPFVLNNTEQIHNFYVSNDTNLLFPVVSMPEVMMEIPKSRMHKFIVKDTAYIRSNITEEHTVSALSSEGYAKIIEFKPGKFVVETHSDTIRPVVLAQAYCNGWRCVVDSKEEIPVFETNHAMMSVYVPEGIHKIEFLYRKPWIKTAFFVQILTLLAIFFALLLKDLFIKKKSDVGDKNVTFAV